MPLAPTELARRSPAGTVYRDAAVRLSLPIGSLIARDGHAVHGDAQVSVRLVDRAADRALFDELFAGDAVTLDAVRQHVAPRLAEAARAFARQHDAQRCLEDRAAFSEMILHRLNEIGFACGLAFLRPADVTLTCPSLEAERTTARDAAEQIGALDRATEVLAKIKAGDIDRLPPREQATALQLMLREQPAVPLHVVAGPAVLRIGVDAPKVQRVAIETDIGPLRSVRRGMLDGDEIIFIGGQRGVVLLGDDIDLPPAFVMTTSSDRGFNSAAIEPNARTLLAAHSEIGIARWNLATAEPLATLATPPGTRWLTALDERLLFAVGGGVYVIDGDSIRTAVEDAEPVVGLHVLQGGVVIVRAAGTIDTLDRATLKLVHRTRRGGAIVCSAAIDAGGVTALAVAGGEGPVDCVNAAGTLLFELHGMPGVRMLAASGNAIAGVSADRQRVALWHADQPAAPYRVHNVTAIVQNRIADLA